MVRNSRFALGACLVAALATVSLAQDSALKPIAANGSVQFVKLSTVMNSKILIQDDQAAGQVVDVVMNESGCIDYVVASYNDKNYVIPYSAVTYRGPGRVIYLDIAPTQFRQVSFFTGNQWPDFYATTYQRNVFNVFGVTNFRNDGPRTSLKPNLDRDREIQDRLDRRPNTNPKADEAVRPNENRKPGTPAPDRGEALPESKPRTTTPPDRLKGDAVPESRDKNSPISKPNPGVVDPAPKKPDLNPAPVEIPKADIPKSDKPRVDPLKPKTPTPPAPTNP